MESLQILVDSNIWINYFRKAEAPESLQLSRLIKEEQVCLCGVVLGEVLQGARTVEEMNLLAHLLEAVPYVNDLKEDWEKAALQVLTLRKKGIAVALSDCLIAAAANRARCSIFSLDEDFSKMSGVKLFRVEQG